MTKRFSDRRGHARFEVVGNLNGTLEVWKSCKLINLSAGGALIESADPSNVGDHVDARVTLGGQTREMRYDVRRVTTSEYVSGERRYQVGIEWSERLADGDTLLSSLSDVRKAPAHLPERRSSVRFLVPALAELSWPHWLTVELVDISASGALINSPAAVRVGERGHLRLRLGERAFIGEVEIRRVDPRPPPRPGVWLGTEFTSLDEANRGALDHFMGGGSR